MSSKEYWQQRWAAGAQDDRTSWPDRGARLLELAYLKRNLPVDRTCIFEIGCGNLQLAEDPALLVEVGSRPYKGIDGSEEAIRVARRRAAAYPKMSFSVADLTRCRRGDPVPGGLILSKRTLQNLTPKDRLPLWGMLRRWDHGILIEDFLPARQATDSLRAQLGRESLGVPSFNWPVIQKEIDQGLYRTVKIDPFMGYYYQITRVQRDVPVDVRLWAKNQCEWAIKASLLQPFLGPVVAISW